MDKKQTAMMVLVKELEINAKNIQPMNIDDIIVLIESKYIEIEKEQIINTFKDAQGLHSMGYETRASQYFNQTYQ